MKAETKQKLSSAFKDIKTLVAMQLKESLPFRFKGGDTRSLLLKLALCLLAIAAISGVVALVLFILGLLGVLGTGGYLPIPMWNVVFFVMILLNFFACIGKVTDALYLASDNRMLLCLPVKSNYVFFSKLIVFFFNELFRNCFSVLPLLLGFGIIYGLPFYFYPWLIIVMVLLSLLPVALASLISIPTLYVKTFLKKHSYVESIALLAILIGLTALVFYLVTLIPNDLQIAAKWNTDYFPSITGFSKAFETVLYPLVFLTHLAIGYTGVGSNNPRVMTVFTPYTPLIVLGIIAIVALFFFLANLLAKPLYFKMASKTFEFEKVSTEHSYKISASKLKTTQPLAIVYEMEGSEEEKKKEMRFLLKKLSSKHIGTEDKEALLKALNDFAARGSFTYAEMEIGELGAPVFLFVEEEGMERLALLEGRNGNNLALYCPYHSPKKNIQRNSFFSFLLKEIRVDLRSSETIAGHYLLFIVTPLAVLILNVIFNSMKKSFSGQMYTVLFNALVICLITLASNVSMASVYSREGQANYQLRASPINYIRTLTSKLFIRASIVTLSLVFTMIIYAWNNTLSYMRMDILFFCFYFLYLGHLLWSAELDYMNPQINLYAEMGANGSININEAKSSALAFVLSFAFAGLTYFFVSESVPEGFYRLLIVSTAFLGARILLFLRKVKAYGMSTYEGRGQK